MGKPIITKAEFIAAYCAASGVSWDDLKEKRVALPCNCDDESCSGWAMVPNDPISTESHERQTEQAVNQQA
jgi:hypothetical protein